MSTLKFHKVTSVPGTLDPDAIYYVLEGGRIRSFITNNAGNIESYLSGSEVAELRQSNPVQVNIGASSNRNTPETLFWDETVNRILTTNASINGANEEVTFTGDFSKVEIKVNIKVIIPNASAVTRPNQFFWVRRTNDNLLFPGAATGYIRDSADHEESSYNFAFTDHAPVTNPTYVIEYVKDSTNNGSVTTEPDYTLWQLEAFY